MKARYITLFAGVLMMSTMSQASTLTQEIETAVKQAAQEALAHLVESQKKSLKETAVNWVLDTKKPQPNEVSVKPSKQAK
ncbi:hypothetical protein AAEU32_05350 [Pseudoalteromonas sp. SSDWG2]|uniref:hypothetical protein n=1 Tax=Pseudoalteromonas sp. SSDWG2 TaxID=3139391 RepID=UPI003BAC7C02